MRKREIESSRARNDNFIKFNDIGWCENQLDVHINGSLNVGITPQKIIEVFLQCIPYTGFPRVLNAVGIAKKVFKSRNLTLPIAEARGFLGD